MFAQGPIIDSDPAPGRSPGPPVNSSTSSSINQFNGTLTPPSVESSAPNDSALFLSSSLPAETNHSDDNQSTNKMGEEEEEQKPSRNSQPDHQNIVTNSNRSALAQNEEILGERLEVEESSMNNSSATPGGTTIKDALVSSGNKPRASKNKGSVSTSTTAWPRNRRSNRGTGKASPAAKTTTTTPPDPVLRIAVATVQSSDQDNDLGQVNLFCGDTLEERRLRERRFASEPDDVIVKLQSSQVFWGRNKSESGMKRRDGGGDIDDDTQRMWQASDEVDTNTTVPSPSSVSSVNEGDVYPVTSYPDQSSSSSSSSVVTTHSSPHTDPSVGIDADVGRSDRVKNNGNIMANDKGGGFEAKDSKTRDHGVPVLVDVTHDVFDSRFGLVAGIEYRGKCRDRGDE